MVASLGLVHPCRVAARIRLAKYVQGLEMGHESLSRKVRHMTDVNGTKIQIWLYVCETKRGRCCAVNIFLAEPYNVLESTTLAGSGNALKTLMRHSVDLALL